MRSLPPSLQVFAAFGFGLLVVTVTSTRTSLVAKTVPVPSANQWNALQFRSLSMVQYFGLDTWNSSGLHEHNNHCLTEQDCPPASLFRPTNLSTDQWVETAARMGAREICLTVQNDEGFCLWNTSYSNYSVMHSPYGQDLVQEFLQSLLNYNTNKTLQDQIRPCYAMNPNRNGYLTNVLKWNSNAFVEAQLGMLAELLDHHHTLPPSRLYWNHYGQDCHDQLCPEGSFPTAWPRLVQWVRDRSPTTWICPGPDCHSADRAYYPSWNKNAPKDESQPNSRSDNGTCDFWTYETRATMTDGWFCRGDGNQQRHWNASDIWDHYMGSVGEGWINTLNVPICTTGQIHPGLVQQIDIFGTALQSLLDTVHASQTDVVGYDCDNTTILELPVYGDYNAVLLQEDLSKGQRIAKYAIDYFNYQEWIAFPTVHGQSVGHLLIDWVDPPKQPSTIVRLRCLEAFQLPIYLKRMSVHTGTRPKETTVKRSSGATVSES